jgi:peptidoglycan/LPS O-acetylase OafA/YrhL
LKPAPHDQAVEGLRALAALAVIYAHFTSPGPRLDPVYAPSEIFWRFELALPAVMIFFLLSGYVIGITTAPRPAVNPSDNISTAGRCACSRSILPRSGSAGWRNQVRR